MPVGTLKRNVFLVGFMGVGKTTVARRLARDLGVVAIDVDSYLARKHGKDATQLFRQRGERALRGLEARALAECAALGPAVISCGEGIVATPEARELIKREGFAVMLESSEAASLGRIRSLRTRPLLAQGCDTSCLWNERKPLYEEVADALIDVRGKSTAAVAAELARMLVREGVYAGSDSGAQPAGEPSKKRGRSRRGRRGRGRKASGAGNGESSANGPANATA